MTALGLFVMFGGTHFLLIFVLAEQIPYQWFLLWPLPVVVGLILMLCDRREDGRSMW